MDEDALAETLKYSHPQASARGLLGRWSFQEGFSVCFAIVLSTDLNLMAVFTLTCVRISLERRLALYDGATAF